MLDTYIAIDPGEKNGVAIWDKPNGLRLFTLSFWHLADYIQLTIVPAYKMQKVIIPHFIVEDPGLNKFMYAERINNKNYVEAMRIARNVGQNIGDAKRIIELIKKHELIIDTIRPLNTSKKWTAEYFNYLYKRPLQTNQHVRDAAKLISNHWVK